MLTTLFFVVLAMMPEKEFRNQRTHVLSPTSNRIDKMNSISPLTLPSWLVPSNYEGQSMTVEAAMRLAIDLSLKNIQHQTGGPFGCVILNKDGVVISVGVNLVVSMQSSMYHAEVVAILRAQHNSKNFRVDGGTLVTSSQPCCMCYGSLFWSGIDHVAIGARKEDVETNTEFEEGPLPEDWQFELTSRNIRVTTDVLRKEATDALISYADVHY